MKTLSRLLLSVVLFVGFLADSSFGKAFGPRAASPAAFSATNAAWYSLAGSAADSTYLLSGGNVTLIADRSGNSAVNGLVMNGVIGNYASTPDSSAVSITGDMDARVFCALADWTPSGVQILLSKRTASTDFWQFGINTNGTLTFLNKVSNVNVTNVNSTSVVTVSDFSGIWVRVTYDVDNGASGNDVIFYTSPDGITWTKLGNTVTTAGVATITDTTAPLRVATADTSGNEAIGIFYRAQLYNGIAGTLAFDANFTTVAKLAASFTESSANAATVTINTSGDLGARISGARDLVQLTAAKQPAFSVVSGYDTATFDGSNDYMKAAAFSLSQPHIIYLTGSQITWTDGDVFSDGNSTNERAAFFQNSSTPNTTIFAGSAPGANNGSWALNTRAVARALFNGASSGVGINLGSLTSINPGTNSPNGAVIGARFDGTTPANMTFNEALLRSAADDTTTQNALTAYEMLTWGITP